MSDDEFQCVYFRRTFLGDAAGSLIEALRSAGGSLGANEVVDDFGLDVVHQLLDVGAVAWLARLSGSAEMSLALTYLGGSATTNVADLVSQSWCLSEAVNYADGDFTFGGKTFTNEQLSALISEAIAPEKVLT